MRFDLDAYLRRIGVSGETEVDADHLRALHLAHLSVIPFENLDVRLGRPISLDPDALMDKLVRRRRGGYCFEHNTLMACVLRELGVRVETLEARVRPPGARSVLPRTHMALRVVLPDRSWLADVGFGADGPLWPVPWDGEESPQPDALYRVATDPGGGRILQRKDGDAFRDLYSFLPTPALLVDFEVANHFTSTHPSSPFVRTLTLQRSTLEARYVLRGRTLTIRRRDGEEAPALTDEQLPGVIRSTFEIDVTDRELAHALAGLEPPGS